MKEFQKDDSPELTAEALEVRQFSSLRALSRCCTSTHSIAWACNSPFPNICNCFAQDNIFEWHFVVRGAADTEFEVRILSEMPA